MSKINVLEVNNTDLLGKSFNGYDMLFELDRDLFDIKQLVIYKYSDNDEVINLFDRQSLLSMYNRMLEFEANLSIHSNLSISSPALINSAEYKNCDIIHFHMFHNTKLSLYSLLKISKEKKVIITLHDPWFLTGRCVHFYDCEKWKNGCVDCPDLSTLFPFNEDNCNKHWNLKKSIFNHISTDIVVSTKWMYDLVKSSPIFEHQKNIHFIPFGLDLNNFKEKYTREEVRKHFNIPLNDVVLFLRAQNEFKGTEYIVQALEQLKTDKTITILTCEVKGLLKDIENKYNIVDLGLIGEEEIIKAFNCCDIFLMPSKGESFGVMAIEAMACMKPVIVFNNSTLPSVTFAPDCGIVAKDRDADDLCKKIEFLISNPEECKSRGRLGRKFVEEHYGKDNYYNKIEELYRFVFKRKIIKKQVINIENNNKSLEAKKIMNVLNEFSKCNFKKNIYLRLRYDIENVNHSNIDFSNYDVQNIIDKYCNTIYYILIEEKNNLKLIYRDKIKNIIIKNILLFKIAKMLRKILSIKRYIQYVNNKKILFSKIFYIGKIKQKIIKVKDLNDFDFGNIKKGEFSVEKNNYLFKDLIRSGYIPIFVSDGFNNLGDMLNYYILDKLGYRYFRVSYDKCKLIMIGSVLDQYFVQNNRNINNKPIHIWGSGFIEDSLEEEQFIRPVIIHALRGKLSKERCEKILSRKLDNIALGDPGLLAPMLIDWKTIKKKYDVGIIPHYIDRGNKHLENIKLKTHSSTIIDITGDTIETIIKIAECRVVVSSGLHGLIIADSFDIPNQWIVLSDNVYGNGYKFRDYYSVYNINNPRQIDLRNEIIKDKDIRKIVKDYKVQKSQVEAISKNLIDSFPKNIFRQSTQEC